MPLNFKHINANEQILDGSIGTSLLADGSVTAAKLAIGAITSSSFLVDSNIDFNNFQALQFRVENVNFFPIPGNPGRLIWRTDLRDLFVDSDTALNIVSATYIPLKIHNIIDGLHMTVNSTVGIVANDAILQGGVPFTEIDILAIGDATNMTVSSTTGIGAGYVITQDTISTTVTTVVDATHLVVASTAGFVVDVAAVSTPYHIAIVTSVLDAVNLAVNSTAGFIGQAVAHVDFGIVTVTSSTQLFIDDSTAMSPGDVITQGLASTIILTVVDLTHITVVSTTGFSVGIALVAVPIDVNAVPDLTHLTVSNTAGFGPADLLTQGLASTSITTVPDLTHLVVASTIGFAVNDAADTTVVVDSTVGAHVGMYLRQGAVSSLILDVIDATHLAVANATGFIAGAAFVGNWVSINEGASVTGIHSDLNPILHGTVQFLSGTNVHLPQLAQTITVNVPAVGTTGDIQFNLDAGNDFGADSNLFWDNTNKRLGLGTNIPATTLDVDGAGHITGELKLDDAFRPFGNIFSQNNLVFRTATDNANAFTFQNSTGVLNLLTLNSTDNSLIIEQGPLEIHNTTNVEADITIYNDNTNRTNIETRSFDGLTIFGNLLLGAGGFELQSNAGSGSISVNTAGAIKTWNFNLNGSFDFAGGSINAATALIHNVVDPVLPQDAATKNYVDGPSHTVAGSDKQIQFNQLGNFGASPALEFDYTNGILLINQIQAFPGDNFDLGDPAASWIQITPASGPININAGVTAVSTNLTVGGLITDTSAVTSINTNGRFLYDSAGTITVGWNAQALNDASGNTALGWNNRRLFGSDGTTLNLDWNTPGTVVIGNGLVTIEPSFTYEGGGGISINSNAVGANSSTIQLIGSATDDNSSAIGFVKANLTVPAQIALIYATTAPDNNMHLIIQAAGEGPLGDITLNNGTGSLWLFDNVGVLHTPGAIDLATHQIHNVVDPTAPQDAATKNYVDGGAHTVAPPTNSVQYNNGGVFGGSAQFTFNPTLGPGLNEVALSEDGGYNLAFYKTDHTTYLGDIFFGPGGAEFEVFPAGTDLTFVTNIAAGAKNWIFGGDGRTILPGAMEVVGNAVLGASIVFADTTGGAIVGNINVAASEFEIQSNAADITISSNTNGPIRTWTFDTTGKLNLPGGDAFRNIDSSPTAIGNLDITTAGALNLRTSNGTGLWVTDNGAITFVGINNNAPAYALDVKGETLLTAGTSNFQLRVHDTIAGSRAGISLKSASNTYGVIELEGVENNANLQIRASADATDIAVSSIADLKLQAASSNWTFAAAGTLTTPGDIIIPSGAALRSAGAIQIISNESGLSRPYISVGEPGQALGGIFVNLDNTSTTQVYISDNGSVNGDASAVLQADSTTRGFLPPRMTTAQKNAIVSPATGLIVYDTTINFLQEWNGTTWHSVAPFSSYQQDVFDIVGPGNVFTLSFTPLPNSQTVFYNGLSLAPGVTEDYTISGNVITLDAGIVLANGDKILVIYPYSA